MSFKEHKKLLVISHTPPGGTSILDWCPFGGKDKLDDIITEYNEGCFQSYLKTMKYEDLVEKLEGIDIDNHDLSTVRTMKLADFKNIRFLLIDLDAIKGKSEKENLEFIRRHLDMLSIRCFLIQVSSLSDVDPYPEDFRPTLSMHFGPPMWPEIPEIINNLDIFKKALSFYCKLVFAFAKDREETYDSK